MKKKFNYLLLLLFTALVIYMALRDNFSLIMEQIFSINIYYLLLAIALVTLFWLGKSLVLYINVKSFNHKFSFWKAIIITLKTQFFDGVTPFATGGQPFEIYMLKKEGISVSEGSGIIISNSLVYQISRVIICVFAVLVVLLTKVVKLNSFIFVLVVISFIFNCLTCLAYFGAMFSKKFSRFLSKVVINILSKIKVIKDKEATTEKMKTTLSNYHKTSKYIIDNKSTFIKMIVVNILFFTAYYSIPFVLFTGVGYSGINFIELFALMTFAQIVGSFIPVPGSTGGLEYFFVLFASIVVTNEINGVMILWRFITYYLGLVIGAILVDSKRNG